MIIYEKILILKYALISYLIILTFVSFFWSKIISKFKFIKLYKSVQRLHSSEIPRLGGLVIYSYLYYFNLEYLDNSFLNIILISFLPIAAISLLEDFRQDTYIGIRLFSMILGVLILFYKSKIQFPDLNLYFFNSLFKYYFINIIFFGFAILVMINGMNFIDGTNGLAGFTSIIQLTTLMYLSNEFNDDEIFKVSLFSIILIFCFILFNFPFGKIFLGDFGAYFLGFYISCLVIYFFGKHSSLISWNAVLLLFYPCFEILFSFIRKFFYEKKTPLTPDKKHLHSLIYRYYSLKGKSQLKSNNIATMSLLIFSACPLFVIFIYKKLFLIFILIIILSILYVLTYLYFFKKILIYEKKS